jgi:hypothetical protein
MAFYASFAACFKTVRNDILFLKANLLQKESQNLFDDMTFSCLIKKKPIVNKLEESINKILKAHLKAYDQLKKCYNRAGPYFKNLSTYGERYAEIKGPAMQLTLMLTKINTNMLYIEYLRLQGNHEEMGKYAKAIVTQAFLAEFLIGTHELFVDSKLVEFVKVCQRLYKSIALWSLFFPYVVKIKTNTYEDDEDINILGSGCSSFVDYIGQAHRELLTMPGIKESPLYGLVSLYFKDVLVHKSLEVTNAYSLVFGGSKYDESHFNRMHEIDYVSRTTGEDSM